MYGWVVTKRAGGTNCWGHRLGARNQEETTKLEVVTETSTASWQFSYVHFIF